MTTFIITAKRRVTLTKELLNHLGVGPGAKIKAEKLPGGRIVFRVFFRGFAGGESERDKHAHDKGAKRLHGAKNFQISTEL